MRTVTFRGLLLAALLTLVPAAGARAATFTPTDGAELQQALTTAAADNQDDTIILDGATTYTRSGGFAYSSGHTANLTLVGNGATVTGTGSGLHLMVFDGGTIDISGLKVQAVQAFDYAFTTRYSGTTATLRDITVSGATSDTGASYGFFLGGDSVTATNLTANVLASQGIAASATSLALTGASVSSATGRQIEVTQGTAVLNDLNLHDPEIPSVSGIEVDAPGAVATVQRARISGSTPAASAYFSGNLTLTDSLLLVSAPSGRGLVAGDINNSSAKSSTIDAQRVTIVGTGASNQIAAVAGDGGGTTGADHHTITIGDSIIANIPTVASCNEPDAAATNTIAFATTAFPAGFSTTNSCADGMGDPGITFGSGMTTQAPVFADAAAGDYRQLRTSPLLDLGATSDPGMGADLGGGLRFVNGAVDLGAYEYQRAAPAVTAGGSPSPVAGQPVTLTATATDADPGETAQLTYAWAFSDGGTATGASVEHVFAQVGSATATVTVTDPTGLKTVKDVPLTIAAVPPAGGGATPTPGTPAGPAAPAGTPPDRTPPALRSLRVAKTISRGAKLPGAVTRGGQVRFTLSEAATVAVRFERLAGKRAVRVPGSFKLKLAAGKRSLRFTGRVTRKRTLKPGAYRMVLTATDAAGNAAAPVRAAFTLR